MSRPLSPPAPIAALALLVAGLGCAFQPSPLVPSGGGDAALAADAPASADGAPRPPDAAVPTADAETDPCPVKSIALPLDTVENGALGGQSRYEPTCTVGTPTGPEDLYHVDVPVGGTVDLVVDVAEKAADLDTVVDLTPMCRGQSQPGGFCEDSGPAGAGEVVVDEFNTGGRRYIAVDSLAGGGGYTVTAFVRQVVDTHQPCTPDLSASRCSRGEQCLDHDGDGVATCEPIVAVADTDANDDPCTTSTLFTGDGVFDGVVESAGEPDVIALDPPGERHLRIHVHDGRGGCAVDLVAEVLVGASCESAAPVATDDNSGLGACPKFESVAIPAGQRSWLRLRPSATAKLRPNVGYEVVVDMF